MLHKIQHEILYCMSSVKTAWKYILNEMPATCFTKVEAGLWFFHSVASCLLLTTLGKCLETEGTNCCNSESDMFFYSLLIRDFSSTAVQQQRLPFVKIPSFQMGQILSLGDGSGLQADQFSHTARLVQSRAAAIFSEYGLALFSNKYKLYWKL